MLSKWKNIDSISGGILIVFGISIFLFATGFPDEADGYPGPGAFPQVLAALIFVCGLVLVISPPSSAIETEKLELETSPIESRFTGVQRVLLGVSVVAIVPILVEYIEFIPLLAGVCFAIVLLLERTKKGLLLGLVVAISTAAFVYIIFTLLLRVQL